MPGTDTVAVVAAGSQIARDYVEATLSRSERELVLFSRTPDKLQTLISGPGMERCRFLAYDEFGLDRYDAIVNFAGASDPATLARMGRDIIDITDRYDNLCIGYLRRNGGCRYVFLSSGAAYGDVFRSRSTSFVQETFDLENTPAPDYYGASKYLAETRHRNLRDLSIVDLRVFSYFSERQDLDARLLMSDVARSILGETTLETSDENIWRDYLHPDDFFRMLEAIFGSGDINAKFDCYSRAPIDKLSMLGLLAETFGLSYRLVPAPAGAGSRRMFYFSTDCSAASIGFAPRFSSAECVTDILHRIVKKRRPAT